MAERFTRFDVLARIATVFLAVLLFAPQPKSLPLAAAVQTGLAAQAAGDLPLAAESLAIAYTRQPWNAVFAFDVGRAELAAGHYESALEHLNVTARLGGWTPELRVLAGDAYFALGDGPNALTQWQTAARDRPEDVNLRRRLADAYESSGKFSEAMDSLNLVAAATPDDALVHFRLGQLLAVFDPAAAPDALERAAALDATLAPPSTALVNAIRQGQASGDEAYLAGSVGLVYIQSGQYLLAEAAFQRAIGINPSYGEAYAYLGLARDRLGRDGGPAFQQAVQLAPESALAHSLLGLHYRRAGAAEAALESLHRALELDEGNPALAAEIAGAHEALGDFELAEEWYSTAVTFAPGNPAFALLLAQFYVENEIKLAESGLAAAQQAVELAPSSAAAHDALGFAHVLLDDLETGEQELRTALDLDPELISANYHLGVVLAARLDRDGAAAQYRRTLELDPQGRFGNLALKALAVIESQ